MQEQNRDDEHSSLDELVEIYEQKTGVKFTDWAQENSELKSASDFNRKRAFIKAMAQRIQELSEPDLTPSVEFYERHSGRNFADWLAENPAIASQPLREQQKSYIEAMQAETPKGSLEGVMEMLSEPLGVDFDTWLATRPEFSQLPKREQHSELLKEIFSVGMPGGKSEYDQMANLLRHADVYFEKLPSELLDSLASKLSITHPGFIDVHIGRCERYVRAWAVGLGALPAKRYEPLHKINMNAPIMGSEERAQFAIHTFKAQSNLLENPAAIASGPLLCVTTPMILGLIGSPDTEDIAATHLANLLKKFTAGSKGVSEPGVVPWSDLTTAVLSVLQKVELLEADAAEEFSKALADFIARPHESVPQAFDRSLIKELSMHLAMEPAKILRDQSARKLPELLADCMAEPRVERRQAAGSGVAPHVFSFVDTDKAETESGRREQTQVLIEQLCDMDLKHLAQYVSDRFEDTDQITAEDTAFATALYLFSDTAVDPGERGVLQNAALSCLAKAAEESLSLNARYTAKVYIAQLYMHRGSEGLDTVYFDTFEDSFAKADLADARSTLQALEVLVRESADSDFIALIERAAIRSPILAVKREAASLLCVVSRQYPELQLTDKLERLAHMSALSDDAEIIRKQSSAYSRTELLASLKEEVFIPFAEELKLADPQVAVYLSCAEENDRLGLELAVCFKGIKDATVLHEAFEKLRELQSRFFEEKGIKLHVWSPEELGPEAEPDCFERVQLLPLQLTFGPSLLEQVAWNDYPQPASEKLARMDVIVEPTPAPEIPVTHYCGVNSPETRSFWTAGKQMDFYGRLSKWVAMDLADERTLENSLRLFKSDLERVQYSSYAGDNTLSLAQAQLVSVLNGQEQQLLLRVAEDHINRDKAIYTRAEEKEQRALRELVSKHFPADPLPDDFFDLQSFGPVFMLEDGLLKISKGATELAIGVETLEEAEREFVEQETTRQSLPGSLPYVQEIDQLLKNIFHNADSILATLCKMESHEVALSELKRSIELLGQVREAGREEDFYLRTDFSQKLEERGYNSLVVYLPRNEPLFSVINEVLFPSLVHKQTYVVAPDCFTKDNNLKSLCRSLGVKRFLGNAAQGEVRGICDGVSLAKERQVRVDNSGQRNQTVKLVDAKDVDTIIFAGDRKRATEKLKSYAEYGDGRELVLVGGGAGHNPLILSRTVSLQDAVDAAIEAVVRNCGQDCTSPCSILLEGDEDRERRFLELLGRRIAEIPIGYYSDWDGSKPQIGPLNSADHQTWDEITSFYQKYGSKKYEGPGTYRELRRAGQDIVNPTIFSIPLSEGPNLIKKYAPFFVIQRYSDQEELLREFFTEPRPIPRDKDAAAEQKDLPDRVLRDQYFENAMYISFFGNRQEGQQFVNALSNLQENAIPRHEGGGGHEGRLYHQRQVILNATLNTDGQDAGFASFGGYGPGTTFVLVLEKAEVDGTRAEDGTAERRLFFGASPGCVADSAVLGMGVIDESLRREARLHVLQSVDGESNPPLQ
jgi:hypothetical protein